MESKREMEEEDKYLRWITALQTPRFGILSVLTCQRLCPFTSDILHNGESGQEEENVIKTRFVGGGGGQFSWTD